MQGGSPAPEPRIHVHDYTRFYSYTEGGYIFIGHMNPGSVNDMRLGGPFPTHAEADAFERRIVTDQEVR